VGCAEVVDKGSIGLGEMKVVVGQLDTGAINSRDDEDSTETLEVLELVSWEIEVKRVSHNFFNEEVIRKGILVGAILAAVEVKFQPAQIELESAVTLPLSRVNF
jgi:GTPase